MTSSLSGTRSNQLSYTPGCVGGGNGTRTRDIQLAKLALYQLSYAPGRIDPFVRGCAKRRPVFSGAFTRPLRGRSGMTGRTAACAGRSGDGPGVSTGPKPRFPWRENGLSISGFRPFARRRPDSP